MSCRFARYRNPAPPVPRLLPASHPGVPVSLSVSVSMGGSLAGTRGTPWRFEVAKSGGAVSTLAFANFSTALVLPSKGG